MVKCTYSTINERDMDMLFLQSISTDQEFARIFTDKTDLSDSAYTVESIELSKMDIHLGESDITVILNCNGKKHALLIEDKIDAIDMPNQHDRYVQRGKKAVMAGEYDSFDVFIVCPEKYWNGNEEARKYEHFVSYEECRDYFASKDDDINSVRCQQVEQAIEKAKKPPTVEFNDAANAFLLKYKAYQKQHYPELDISTNDSVNGWWIEYRTNCNNAGIAHKVEPGYIDLTYSKTAVLKEIFENLATWLRRHGYENILAVQTGKSMSFRIEVQGVKNTASFDDIDKQVVDAWFEAVGILLEIAKVFNMIMNIRN